MNSWRFLPGIRWQSCLSPGSLGGAGFSLSNPSAARTSSFPPPPAATRYPKSMTTSPLLLLLAAPLFAQDAAMAPAVLPGNGLAQHDFFYAGEQKQQQMFIVRKGKVAWSYIVADSKGEISDAVMLSNGNILFAHQYCVTLITPDKKVLWNYDAPAGTEVHTAQPIDRKSTRLNSSHLGIS